MNCFFFISPFHGGSEPQSKQNATWYLLLMPVCGGSQASFRAQRQKSLRIESCRPVDRALTYWINLNLNLVINRVAKRPIGRQAGAPALWHTFYVRIRPPPKRRGISFGCTTAHICAVAAYSMHSSVCGCDMECDASTANTVPTLAI